MPHNDPARVLTFFRCLKLVKGEAGGKPWEPMPWHKEIIKELFSRVDEEGNRMIREAYISVPRKNSKTTFAAALALYMLVMDGENSPGCYIFANSTDQAKQCFNIAMGMINGSDFLRRICKITPSRAEVFVPANNGYFKVMSRAPGTAHGLDASFAIYDELHEAPNGDLYGVALTSMGARTQPLMMAITTAGKDRGSIAYEKYDYSQKVAKGIITDPAFYSYIKEAPPDADWRDPSVWAACNPGWQIAIKPATFEALARQATVSPTAEAKFRQLYLNQWLSSSRRWLASADWEACKSSAKLADFEGCQVYAGLDLSSTRDLTCITLAAQRDGFIYIFPIFFLPSETIENSKANRIIYSRALAAGELVPILGNVIDYDFLVDYIRDLGQRYKIDGIAYDPWNAVHPVAALAADFEMVRYPQGFATISPAAKDFERGILAREILHPGNSLLSWCADNVEIKEDAGGNIKPVKGAPEAKIDGIIASIMAVDLCRKNAGSSVYEDRGVISI